MTSFRGLFAVAVIFTFKLANLRPVGMTISASGTSHKVDRTPMPVNRIFVRPCP